VTIRIERLTTRRLLRLRNDAAKEFRKQLTVGFPTDEDEAGLRRLSAQLKSGCLRVKLFLKHALHAKLYLAHRNDTINPIIAYLGSSNLTFSGLKGQGELNIDVLDRDAAKKLHDWFVDRWEDSRCLDITSELIQIIDESWASERLVSPYHVYLKMAWHLSQDAREGLRNSNSRRRFVTMSCRSKRKRFSSPVVISTSVAAFWSGCCWAGRPGLPLQSPVSWRTIRCSKTLILCPKNLTSMWEHYAHMFGLRAPKVLSQSVAQRDLPKIPRYRLVIIDESR